MEISDQRHQLININMNYKISHLPPPIYKQAKEKFGVDFYKRGVFTYGDTIYFAKGNLTPDIIVHEMKHMKQQVNVGGPENWWKKYFEDEEFRLSQEIEAYQAQYKEVCIQTKDKEQRYKDLMFFVRTLMLIYDLNDLDSNEIMKKIRGNN